MIWRSSIGFDRMLDLANDAMNDRDNYPLYDIERTGEDQYRISLALAGSPRMRSRSLRSNPSSRWRAARPTKVITTSCSQGISMRPLRRVFNLADYVQVKNATFESGMLMIDLVREVPESMKPRHIEIGVAGNDNQQIEQK
jgi:molecular chaperone IbpA